VPLSATFTVIGSVLVCTAVVVFALGNVILITLGLAKVEAIRKNNIKKNMMSFIAEDSTSASSRRLLPIFMHLGLVV
jgi:hypothetical protein